MKPADAEPRTERAHSLVPRFVRTPWLAEALAVNGLVDDAIRMYRLIERGLPAEDIQRPFVSERIKELLRKRP